MTAAFASRQAAAVVGTVLAALTFAHPAIAKEGLEARLNEPIPTGSTPGTAVSIGWTLVDQSGQPFGGAPVFLRVYGASGLEAVEAPVREGRQRGEYIAELRVPAGGIGRIEIGIRGTACYRGGSCQRSDHLIPIVHGPPSEIPDTRVSSESRSVWESQARRLSARESRPRSCQALPEHANRGRAANCCQALPQQR